MQALLSDWGAEVVWVTTCKDAVLASKKAEGKFDILLVDYHLNFGETGIQVAESLIKEKTLPSLSILITANRSNEIREEANEVGLQYLPKPAKPLALKRMIKSFL